MENTQLKKAHADKLIFLGILLFSLGLVSSLCMPLMANPRMGLSAHLEGIMNGIFLVILGLIWQKLLLSNQWLTIAFWLTLYGSFANFIAVLIAAFSGAGKMMPLAGGKAGNPFTENLISALLISLTLAMLIVCAIVLAGLYRYIKSGK